MDNLFFVFNCDFCVKCSFSNTNNGYSLTVAFRVCKYCMIQLRAKQRQANVRHFSY